MSGAEDDGQRPRSGPAWVAGATGYTGQAVVAELCRLGVDVVAHVRPDSPALPQWQERFAALGATLDTAAWEPAAMAAALAAVRPLWVFALLGTTRQRAQADGVEDAPYLRVDYGLTRVLLAAAMDLPRPPRFVYLSSWGAGTVGRGAYLDARTRMEAELRASSLPWTIARPSFVTGADRSEHRPAERIGATLADAALALLGAVGAARTRDRYRSIDATSLARGLCAAALDPADACAILDSAALRQRAERR